MNMNTELFNAQIQRLKNQWPHAYGGERLARIYAVWKNTSIVFFTEMIDIAIDEYRSAPLAVDFPKLEQEALKRRSLVRSETTCGSPLNILEAAFVPAHYSNVSVRERIHGRIALVKDYSRGAITKTQFDEGCNFYDAAMRQEKRTVVKS